MPLVSLFAPFLAAAPWCIPLIPICITVLFLRWYYRAAAACLPPGPPAAPFIGHLPLLIRSNTSLLSLFGELASTYGPIVFLRFGSLKVVLVSSKEAAIAFLKTHDNIFSSRPPSTLARFLFYNSHTIGRAPSGKRLAHLRKICSLELFSSQKMNAFKHVRMEEVKSLLRYLASRKSKVVDMRTALYHLMFNIVSRILISKRYFASYGAAASDDAAATCDGAGASDGEAADFINVMSDISNVAGEMFSMGEFFPHLRVLDLDRFQDRIKAASTGVDRFLSGVLHRRRMNPHQADDQHNDFLDSLLRLRDNGDEFLQGDSVKAVLLDMFTGGIDPCEIAIEWALAELIKHPTCMTKAQEEMAKVVGTHKLVDELHLPELVYLNAVVKETLRLHPPAPLMVPHYSLEPCEVTSFHIPGQTTVVVNVYAIGRDPTVWEKPTEFLPERFLEGNAGMDVHGRDFELLPFGSGRRVCPGTNLALSIVTLTLANLLHAFDWRMEAGKVVDLSEKYGLLVCLANKLETIPVPRPEYYNDGYGDC